MTTPDTVPPDAGARTETVYSQPVRPAPSDDTWWSRYSAAISGFTETTRTVLQADCAYITNQGVFGSGEPGEGTWPPSRVRRGLVMGSVQSGKTASMLGTIAQSLDRGVDIVVVLAGTRVSLWQQTLDRLQSQLDSGPESAEKQRRRLLLPKSPPATQVPVGVRYQLTPMRVRRALDRRQPIIVVALKHSGHLQALGQSLRASVFPEINLVNRAVHMLVVDDEADDGSVLDARVEASMDPIYGNLKQLPRAIVDLWAPPSADPPTNLYTTYAGYTATPQANFLQEEHNPLAPRDFVMTLRTPFDRGEVQVRSSTYTEPTGLTNFYTGGETYYRRGRGAGLCVPSSGVPAEDLADAVRAFLVAGAIKLSRASTALGPRSAADRTFASAEAAKMSIPDPHSMLIHPSALVGDHFAAAELVLEWAGVPNRSRARSMIASGESYLPASLAADIAGDEERWKVWADRYQESARSIHHEFNTTSPPDVPSWEKLRRLLETEVIPGTRVAVVNSDPDADDRPEYEPVLTEEDGSWRAPRDMSTIFVSGNVMSRGLTLEGLTTTLFLRTSDQPRADTQMQMQRWFGYRGSTIELCRVFAPESQLRFFAEYHDVDEALRNVIAEAMNEDGVAPSPVVLQGRDFLATGKIANLGTKPLHPGRKPFIRLVNDGDSEDPNTGVVARLFSSAPSSDVRAAGRVRGRILDEPLSLTEAADLLDELSYNSYQPGPNNQIGTLWSQVEARINAVQALNEGQHLYRPPVPTSGIGTDVRNDCPYSIPAYLRLWDASLSRHIRGMFVSGSRDQLWSMSDLHLKGLQQPRFWVGIRYGEGDPATAGPLADLPFSVRTTRRDVADGVLRTTWGTNDPNAGPNGFRGDEYFDYYHRGEPVPESAFGEEPWRPPGSDGQILFYVNQLPDQDFPTAAVGVCIPSGGPDHFAAYLPRSRSGAA